jgi:hypothetical protein
VDVHQLIELLFRRGRERRMDADAGVIDEEIEIAPLPVVPQGGSNLGVSR